MFQDNPIFFVLFIAFALSAAVQLFYYLYFYLAVTLYKHPETGKCEEPVSVIICARNESENLRENLPSILSQDYHDYEVIVVNDCSEDNSYEVLGEYLGRYPRLRVSNVNKDPKFTHNKKFAQFIGIKAAKNDILVFTDADCRPESDKWLSCMVSNFTVTTDFVLGYGGYRKNRGLLNHYIRYDTLMIAVQYLGMAVRGIPYMGVGRNLAYRKSVFFENGGFGAHSHIISGDDDLFVNANAGRQNTSVEFRRESHTRSVPCTTLRNWFLQKKRHFTTAPLYKAKHKLLLATEPASRLLFYISFIVLLSFLYLWIWLLVIFGIRLVIQLTVMLTCQRKLNEPGIAVFSLFFDIFSPIINSAVLISNFISRPGKNQWK